MLNELDPSFFPNRNGWFPGAGYFSQIAGIFFSGREGEALEACFRRS